MRGRAGFTLLEVTVALVIGAVVALAAYGTAHAALTLEERLARQREGLEAVAIARSLLVDALRHPLEGGGAGMNDHLFQLHDSTDVRGLPMDRVRFVTRGVSLPAGGSGSWEVSVGPALDGVVLLATPRGGADGAPWELRFEGVVGIEARVLDRSGGGTWTERWDAPGRTPAALALTFLTRDGEAAAPSIVVRVGPEVFR